MKDIVGAHEARSADGRCSTLSRPGSRAGRSARRALVPPPTSIRPVRPRVAFDRVSGRTNLVLLAARAAKQFDHVSGRINLVLLAARAAEQL